MDMHKLLNEINDFEIERFCEESDSIEGEIWNDKYGILAAKLALETGLNTPQDFEKIHSVIGHRVREPWVGKFRTVNVSVGSYNAPHWRKIAGLMEKFCYVELPKMDSFEAHNRFQKIHPFQDFNGRVGRILWLTKAIKEDYKYQRTFLHHYYYQTLKHDN